MVMNGYVQGGLKAIPKRLGAHVVRYGLLDFITNPLNPSGVVLIVKSNPPLRKNLEGGDEYWQCPLTGAALVDHGDVFYAQQVGIAYPVMRGIPLLRPEHAVVASHCASEN